MTPLSPTLTSMRIRAASPRRAAGGLAGALATIAVLATTAGCSVLRGPSVEQLDDVVRREIDIAVFDDRRRARMLDLLDDIAALTGEGEAALSRLRARERRLFQDYDSTREDFAVLFAEVEQVRRELQLAVLDAHHALKASASDEEWAQIHAAYTRALAKRLRSLNTAVSTAG